METNQPSEKDVRVDRYVQHMMSATERELFEKEMDADHSLKAEVKIREALLDGIRINKNRELKTRLMDIHEDLRQEKAAPAGRVVPMKWWMAAAASVVFIMALTFWVSGTFSPGGQDLYSQYYERPAYSGARGLADDLAEAGALYNQGRYEEAAFNFEDYLLSNSDDANARFMAAISYLESNNPAQAKSHFMEIIEDDGPLGDRAAWYLALTYLQEDNSREAHFWLKRLAEDTTARPYNTKAEELLKELD